MPLPVNELWCSSSGALEDLQAFCFKGDTALVADFLFVSSWPRFCSEAVCLAPEFVDAVILLLVICLSTFMAVRFLKPFVVFLNGPKYVCIYLFICQRSTSFPNNLLISLPQDCAGCRQACFCREMIPHEVRRTRPPVVFGGSSRCDVVTLYPTTLSR